MSEINGFWDRSGGRVPCSALNALPAWIAAHPEHAAAGVFGVLAAGIFLDERDTYQGAFDDPLLSAWRNHPSGATHLAFQIVTVNRCVNTRNTITALMGFAVPPS